MLGVVRPRAMANRSGTKRSKATQRGGGATRMRRNPEQQQIRAVYDALAAHDFAALKELAFAPFGFCSADVRRSVWLFLLGLTPAEASDGGWRKLLKDVEHDAADARVMHADVQRSVYSWDVHSGLGEEDRSQKRLHLSEVMHAILRCHSGTLGYFQGFHDIALVFLEVGTPSQAFHMVERLALFHLSDQLCCTFEKGLLPLLSVFFSLLEMLDFEVAEALYQAECAEAHFAVPWVLTWFAHSLPRLHHQVMRLYDCLLVSHPAMLFYFAAALLIEHRDAILETTRELPEMVCTIQRLPLNALDGDEWAAHAYRLSNRVPPDRLLSQLSSARRQSLPTTSPLLHFPHPWMPGGDMRLVDLKDVSKLAPIYSGAAPRWPRPSATQLALKYFRLLTILGGTDKSSRTAIQFRRVLSFGVVVVFAWLMSGRVWPRH